MQDTFENILIKNFYNTYYGQYDAMETDTFNELILQAQHGDMEARNEIWVNNLPLLKKIANKYVGYADFDDLIQEGTLGLCRAIELFDVTSGYTFSTYVYAAVRSQILRYLNQNYDIIRKPSYLIESVFQYKKILSKYPESTDREHWEIFNKEKKKKGKKEVTFDTFIKIKMASDTTGSLDANINKDGEYCSLSDFIEDENCDIEREVLQTLFVEDAIKGLDSREIDILEKRFGLFGSEIFTLQEISEIYGLTRERIRQIEVKTLKKIKKQMFL